MLTLKSNSIDSVPDIKRLFVQIYDISGMAYRLSVVFQTIWEERVEEDGEMKYVYKTAKTSRFRFVRPKRSASEDRVIVILKPWNLNYYKKQLTHERIIELIQQENGSRSRFICVYKVGF